LEAGSSITNKEEGENMRRNAINVTIKELVDLAYSLMEETEEKGHLGINVKTIFSIPIVAPDNKKIKDSWRFEKIA